MDAPGQWLAHVWVIRGQCDISAGPAPHCLHWSRCPCDTGWGVPGPAPHCPPHSAIVWSAPSTLPWSVITIRCETDLWGQTLSPIGSVTEHSSVSCVSFEDINTCRSSLGLLCVYCWWRGRSIYNSIVRVFLFPFSSLATDSSWSSRWSPLLRVTSSASADNVSLSGKISNASTPGASQVTRGRIIICVASHLRVCCSPSLKMSSVNEINYAGLKLEYFV